VLPAERAAHQDIRELHIGLLNMMPDAALEATERQFFRLVGESNPIAQFYVHPIHPGRPARAARRPGEHIARYYDTFDRIRAEGLDALIITGANVSGEDLSKEPFWGPLGEVIDWAWENVTTTLLSCLATHAVLHFRYGQPRVMQAEQALGRVLPPGAGQAPPLVADVNTRFDVPHSRWNDVSRAQFEAAGLRVLVESEEVGVHLATSHDGLRMVFFQGHPEYDTISLLKEYKRDACSHAQGKLPAFPPFPENYLRPHEQAILLEWRDRLARHRPGSPRRSFPEAAGGRQPGQHLARHRRSRHRQLDGLHVSTHPPGARQALHGRHRSGGSFRPVWRGKMNGLA
jgi:homoserine O-succinyltransferase